MPSSFLTSWSMTNRCLDAVTNAETYLRGKSSRALAKKTNSVVVLDRSPLIELVDDLEVAVVGTDHVLIDEVEGGVRDELV